MDKLYRFTEDDLNQIATGKIDASNISSKLQNIKVDIDASAFMVVNQIIKDNEDKIMNSEFEIAYDFCDIMESPSVGKLLKAIRVYYSNSKYRNVRIYEKRIFDRGRVIDVSKYERKKSPDVIYDWICRVYDEVDTIFKYNRLITDIFNDDNMSIIKLMHARVNVCNFDYTRYEYK